MANREFVMLGKAYVEKQKKRPASFVGWYASEKYDGIRALWDGGVSRGVLKTLVPWANNARDERYVEPPVCTGLWTRYGNVIAAPDWFLDDLPLGRVLDGELWAGRKTWQGLSKIVKTIVPDEELWGRVSYLTFGTPNYPEWLATGQIRNNNFEHFMDLEDNMEFVRSRIPGIVTRFLTFEGQLGILEQLCGPFESKGSHVQVAAQQKILSESQLLDFVTEVKEMGGEGVMLREPGSYWKPIRSPMLWKLKETNDAEGVVVGYRWGKKTDKGSKLIGLMGSLTIQFGDKLLNLSGFTDSEREFDWVRRPEGSSITLRELGDEYQGMPTESNITNPRFPIGSTVTFTYRELSDDGIPKEGRYLRPHVGA